MRAAGIRALGEPVEILEVDELAPPGADEVLIDVAAAGVGNWDELVRIGSWRIGGPVPVALGTEAAGTVAAAGSGVAELGEGDEVITHPLPLRRHGTWTGRVLVPAATVAPRPPEASWEAGGAFPIPALTAAQALDEALGIESGGWVVVNGAGGATGGLLVQLAAARGAGPRRRDGAAGVCASARTGGTSTARGSRGSGRCGRPVTPSLARPLDGRARFAQPGAGQVITAPDPGVIPERWRRRRLRAGGW